MTSLDSQWEEPPATSGSDEETPELYYETLPAFVEYISLAFGRDLELPTLTWCPEWWRHPEAVYRLDSLWRSWEHLRNDPATGSSDWLRDHLDHHLPILLSINGPFKGCNPQRGHQQRDMILPLAEPPASVYPDETT